MIVVYGLYAIIVANLVLENPSRIDLRRRIGLAAFSQSTASACWGFTSPRASSARDMPVWPVSDAPFLVVRGGEAAVHLSAAAVFALVGLNAFPRFGLMLLISIAFISAISRGGMLSIVIPVVAAAILAGRLKPLIAIAHL